MSVTTQCNLCFRDFVNHRPCKSPLGRQIRYRSYLSNLWIRKLCFMQIKFISDRKMFNLSFIATQLNWKLKICDLKKSNLFSFRLQTGFVSSDSCLSLQIFWLPRIPLFSYHIRKLDSSGVWGRGTRHWAAWPQRLRQCELKIGFR